MTTFRRRDGICPKCNERPRHKPLAYCIVCRPEYLHRLYKNRKETPEAYERWMEKRRLQRIAKRAELAKVDSRAEALRVLADATDPNVLRLLQDCGLL